LQNLSEEYQAWLGSIPASLAAGSTAAEIEEVIAQLDEAHAVLEALELPRVGKASTSFLP
jgi:hypothetical protein